MTTIQIDISIPATEYSEPSAWRMIGAEGKSNNIIELSAKLQHPRFNRILEVGAGDGAILKCLDTKGFAKEMHALEISDSGVRVILSQGIKSLKSCQVFDGYTIPFENDSFDLVILSHVLEHVEYPRILLRELHRVSKYQYIEVPLDNPVEPIDSTFMLSYGHIDCFSPGRMRHLLISEGLLPMADSPRKFACPVMEFVRFENNGIPRTPEAERAFRQEYDASIQRFESMSPLERERSADVYCVLTRQEKTYKRNARLFSHAAQFIKQGQYGNANLIANHLPPNAGNVGIFYELVKLYLESQQPHHARMMFEKTRGLDPKVHRAQELLDKMGETH